VHWFSRESSQRRVCLPYFLFCFRFNSRSLLAVRPHRSDRPRGSSTVLSPVMWRLVVLPQVEDNLVEASLWHDKKQIGLGDQFLAEYVTAIYRILENPSLFSIAGNGLRPCVIK